MDKIIRCPSCKCSKPSTEFHKHSGRKNGFAVYCKLCQKEKNLKYKHDDRKKWKSRNRERRWKSNLYSKYNITEQDYNTLLEKQNNCCAICRSKECGNGCTRFSVDHDHETGEVRGLLCKNCNLGIGNLQDNIDILLNAILYLAKTSKDKEWLMTSGFIRQLSLAYGKASFSIPSEVINLHDEAEEQPSSVDSTPCLDDDIFLERIYNGF